MYSTKVNYSHYSSWLVFLEMTSPLFDQCQASFIHVLEWWREWHQAKRVNSGSNLSLIASHSGTTAVQCVLATVRGALQSVWMFCSQNEAIMFVLCVFCITKLIFRVRCT